MKRDLNYLLAESASQESDVRLRIWLEKERLGQEREERQAQLKQAKTARIYNQLDNWKVDKLVSAVDYGLQEPDEGPKGSVNKTPKLPSLPP